MDGRSDREIAPPKNMGLVTITTPGDRQIVVTRIFDAPRAVVFEAWTNAEHVAQWWDPSGVPLAVRCRISLLAGTPHDFHRCAGNAADRDQSDRYSVCESVVHIGQPTEAARMSGSHIVEIGLDQKVSAR